MGMSWSITSEGEGVHLVADASLNQKHSSKEGSEGEEDLVDVVIGNPTKMEGEEDSSSPHPARNGQDFPAC